MKIWIAAICALAGQLTGCTVFRNTAVEEHVAVSRDLTLQGLAANSSHDKSRAQHFFAQAVDSDPDNAVNHALLAGALARSGDMERAARHYQRARRPAAARMVRELQEQFPEIAAAPRGESQP